MGNVAIVDVLLIILGVVGLFLGNFNYTETKPVLKAGPLQINSQEEHLVSIPTIGSTMLVIIGGCLVFAGRGK